MRSKPSFRGGAKRRTRNPEVSISRFSDVQLHIVVRCCASPRNDEVGPMTPTEIEKIFRDEAGRALATLIRLVGDFDLAEDALQDAVAVALARWPGGELPSNPRAWLVNVG